MNKKKVLISLALVGVCCLTFVGNYYIYGAKAKSLSNSKKEITKMKEENNETLKLLSDKDNELNEKESAFTIREEELNAKSNELTELDNSLKAKETELNTREEELKKNETDFNKWHYVSDTLQIKVEEKTLGTPVKYWVATIKTKSANQLGTTFGSDTYGGTRQGVSTMASRNGGIIGINANGFSFTSNKPVGGPIVRNGKIYADGTITPDTMCIMSDGSFYSPTSKISAQELVAQGLKHTFNWGPVLIKDGQKMPYTDGKPSGQYPRSAIGQVSPTEYVMIVADGKRSNYSVGLTIEQLQSEFAAKGCKYAYNLDGGGSATLYFNGRVVNSPSDGSERPVADCIYFTN